MPAATTGSCLLPKNFPQVLKCCPEACNALVSTVWSVAGLSNSRIWVFLAIAPSSFSQRSLIWEDWALIFWSCLCWDFRTAFSSSSYSDPSCVADTALVDNPLLGHWQVQRTLASSFLYWVNESFGICSSNAFAIDKLLWSYSWLAYCYFMVLSRFTQKSGFLLMTFLTNSCNSSAKASSDSFAYCHLL